MNARWQTLSNRLDRLSSGWTIALAIGVYTLYLAVVMPAQSIESQAYAGDWGGPDRHFFYTPDELYAQVATWGAAGRQHYINFRLGLDIGFALAYAAFLITITSVAGRRAWPGDARRQCLNLVALIPMACDLVENALGIGLVATFPVRLDAVAWLTAGVTALKWLSLALAHVVMLYALSAAARNAVAKLR
ncbi:MAG: hypothetical protein OEV14_11550 [Gammaproteobacteria bacterium]|nr:hypothetical protein [Gammaproteobacteria bacterium]